MNIILSKFLNSWESSLHDCLGEFLYETTKDTLTPLSTIEERTIVDLPARHLANNKYSFHSSHVEVISDTNSC